MESRRDGPQLSMRHDDNDDDVSVKSLQGPLQQSSATSKN